MAAIKVQKSASSNDVQITLPSGELRLLSASDVRLLTDALLQHHARTLLGQETGSGLFKLRLTGNAEVSRLKDGVELRIEFHGGGWMELTATNEQATQVANRLNDYARPLPERHRPKGPAPRR